MEYILGIVVIILASMIVWYFLPPKGRALMPYYWISLAGGFLFCFIKEPYRIERIIYDLTQLIK